MTIQQYHLGRKTSTWSPSCQPVLEGTIGTAYRRLDVSSLQDGVTSYVYERTRDIAPEEYQAISAELTASPEYAAQYHSPV